MVSGLRLMNQDGGADTNSENNDRSGDEDEDCTTYHGRMSLVV